MWGDWDGVDSSGAIQVLCNTFGHPSTPHNANKIRSYICLMLF